MGQVAEGTQRPSGSLIKQMSLSISCCWAVAS